MNPRGVNPLVLARRALASYDGGAQGIALYQSDTGVQRPGLREAISLMSSPPTLRDYVANPHVVARYPVTAEHADYGIDNHSLALKPQGTTHEQ